MHRTTYVILALLLFSLLSPCVLADKKPLTNNDVVKMVKAGLPSEIIIESIRSSEQDFDVSPDGLINLKQQGVPDTIIQAMVAKTKPTRMSGSSDPNPSGVPFGSTGGALWNVILIDGPSRIELKQGTSGNRTSGGGMKVLNPFGKIKMLQVFKGNHAQLRTSNAAASFEVTIPSDYKPSDHILLVKLDVKSDRREISTARGRIGASVGISDDDIVPTTYDEIRSNAGARSVYTVRPVKPLPPGEYAIALEISSFYDFGVDAVR